MLTATQNTVIITCGKTQARRSREEELSAVSAYLTMLAATGRNDDTSCHVKKIFLAPEPEPCEKGGAEINTL